MTDSRVVELVLRPKLLFIGVDGGMWHFIRKLSSQGLLPHLSELMDMGTAFESIPCVPVDTPTNWSTLMSGASPFTHGVISFSTHLPGETPAEGQYIKRTQDSGFSKAEFFWSSAERAGIRCAVINYPVGWPPQIKNGFVVGGMTPGGDLWRLSKPKVFSTAEPFDMENRIKGLKIGFTPLRPLRDGEGVSFDIKVEGTNCTLHFSSPLSAGDSKGLEVSGAGVPSSLKLSEGGWSPWMKVPAAKGEEGVFKLKLGRFRDGGSEITVYITQVFKASGWAFPAGLESRLLHSAGPYMEGLETPFVSNDPKRPYGPSNMDGSLVLEHAKMQASWFSAAAEELTRSSGYDALVMHYHLIDSLNHTYLGHLHKGHPAYDEEKAAAIEELYGKAYSLIDEMIGKITALAGRDSVTVVTSDHAALPCWKYVSVEAAFVRAGLARYDSLGSGRSKIDLAGSKVFTYHDPLHVWVNLKGREKGGSVEPRDYDAVVDAAIDALYSIRDPDDGSKVVRLAVRKDSMRRGGKAGERLGDVMFFLKPGYSNWDGTVASLKFDKVDDSRLRDEVVDSFDVGGHHTTYLPAETMGDFSNNSFTILSGHGVAQGARPRVTPRLLDVVPTISHLTGIPPPADSEGEVIYEAVS